PRGLLEKPDSVGTRGGDPLAVTRFESGAEDPSNPGVEPSAWLSRSAVRGALAATIIALVSVFKADWSHDAWVAFAESMAAVWTGAILGVSGAEEAFRRRKTTR